jgi:itaconate CoA-transferase
MSSYFVWLNRTKESMTLDLKRQEGAAVLARLIANADVFVQNLAPGAAERLGLSGAALCARHERLIACTVSGYGSTGPYADKKAYDLLVQSEVGLLSITGTEAEPARVGISVADIAAGMYAYSGILAALLARASTGRGTTVEVSLFDALGEWMQQPAYFATAGAPPPRSGPNHASIAPYGPFRTGDGRQIYLGIQNAREWTRFCGIVLNRPALADDPQFATNPARVRNRQALQGEIERAFAGLALDDVITRLEEAAIAYARMNTVDDFVAHPQFAARDSWRTIGSPSGPIRATRPPARIDGVDPAMGDVPALGQHTDQILSELGIDRATIARWRTEGIV